MVFPSNIIVSPEKTAIKSDLSSSFNNTDNNLQNNLQNINDNNDNIINNNININKDTYNTNSYILDTLNSIVLLNNKNIVSAIYEDSSSDDDCDKSIFIDKIDKIILENDDKLTTDTSDDDINNLNINTSSDDE